MLYRPKWIFEKPSNFMAGKTAANRLDGLGIAHFELSKKTTELLDVSFDRLILALSSMFHGVDLF